MPLFFCQKIFMSAIQKTHVLNEWMVLLRKLADSGVFALFLLACIVLTHYAYPSDARVPRYDFLFMLAIAFQIFLLWTRLETLPEAVVIMIFHVMAMCMEIFKTQDAIASWYYPEAFYLGIGKVPLFAGFMYSAVGSAIARGMRVFEVRLLKPPRLEYVGVLVALIYMNFFTHHYMMNLRWPLFVIALVLYQRTHIQFVLVERVRQMPIIWVFAFIACCTWLAENLATFTRVWLYPTQKDGWIAVDWDRLLAWYLLIQLSFVLVSALLKRKPARY